MQWRRRQCAGRHLLCFLVRREIHAESNLLYRTSPSALRRTRELEWRFLKESPPS